MTFWPNGRAWAPLRVSAPRSWSRRTGGSRPRWCLRSPHRSPEITQPAVAARTASGQPVPEVSRRMRSGPAMFGQSTRGDMEVSQHDECASNASRRQRPSRGQDRPWPENSAGGGTSTGQPTFSLPPSVPGREPRDIDMIPTLTSGRVPHRARAGAGTSNDIGRPGVSDLRYRLYYRVFTVGKPAGVWLQSARRAERDLDDWRNWPKSTDCG